MANKNFTWNDVDEIYNVLETLQDDGFIFTNKDDFDGSGWLNVGKCLPCGKLATGRNGDKKSRVQLWVEDNDTCSLYVGVELLNALNLKNIRRLASLQKRDSRLWEDVEIRVDFAHLNDCLYTLSEILANIQRTQARTNAVKPKADTQVHAS